MADPGPRPDTEPAAVEGLDDRATGGDSAPTETAPVAARSARAERSRAVGRRMLAHPATVVAALGTIVIALDLWWVQHHRFVGSLEVDETGYLAAALRYQRNAGDGLQPLAARVLETITGPLVPLLSTPLVAVGGRSVWAAQAIQPVLHVVAAVAVTGIVARVASRRTALICGIAALTLPAALLLDRSYQYATAASAFLCLAIWALLASDRGRKVLPMIGFGAAVAAMPLSRTMAIGFVPAVAVASLVWIRWEWRSIRNLAIAAGVCFLGAGVWWLQGWDGIMGYLQRSGYSEFSGYWGSSRFTGRFGRRWEQLQQDVRVPFLVIAVATAATSLVELVWIRLRGQPFSAWAGARREVLVIWVTVLGGYAALFSTANTGTWFDLPLIFLSIAGLGALLGPERRGLPVAADDVGAGAGSEPPAAVDAPVTAVEADCRPAPHLVWVRRILAGAVVVVAVGTVVASLAPPSGRSGERARSLTHTLYSDTDQILTGNLDADPRLESASQQEREEAAGEWEAANEEIVGVLHRYDVDGGNLVQSVTGSAHLVNINTLLLASETTGETIASIELPVTFETEAKLRAWLTPYTASGAPRIVVRIRSTSLRFPDDRFPDRYDELTEELGWQAHERIDLPDGGYVEILTHPESDPLADDH